MDNKDIKNKISRPISYEELSLILNRFQINSNEKYKMDIDEFIKQENHRRDLFSN